ncbi:MAG: Ig-like domain-containing protein [Candidatus Parcubacteria bacterium]|nr:Ig-like domain-containing protein [Candidatus Parcubacteria bacterium]
MQKKFLLTKKSQGQKKKRFDSRTAKKVLLLILILAVFLFCNIESVLAATIEPGLNEIASPLGLGTMDIRVTIAQIIRVALGLLGIVAVVIILYGGFLYLTSMGEPEKIKKAKDVLRDGVIGLIIILMAFAIASFIINAIMQAIYGPNLGVPPNYGDGGGALGNGIIESHYPGRNAVDVPRNTSIIVTFKVPMSVASIVNNNGTPTDLTDDTIALQSGVPVVKIHQTGEIINVTKVRVSYTQDFKTFVFKPIDYLGSPDQPLNYTVELTNDIKKSDRTSAFGSFGGYKWSFDVSTRLDLTPPQVESVIPKPQNESKNSVPRNMVIQINFNEAINPMTINGKVDLENGGKVGPELLKAGTYDIINVLQLSNKYFVAGQFNYGNQYRTVEFVSNDLCGKNACGEDVFCLPSSQNIEVLIKAATLDGKGPSALFPYDGIVDMADNSLDGNKDGQAQGPQTQSTYPPYNFNNPTVITSHGDDAQWSFYTNDIIDLIPPQLETGYLPEAGATKFSPLASIIIPFDKLMMATSIKPDRGYGDGYCKCTTDVDCGCATNPDSPQCDTANKCDLVHGYCLNKDNTQFVCTESIPKVLCPKPARQDCQEKHHLTLVQPIESTYIPRGYWLSSQNNPEETTIATLDHYPLAEETIYSIIAGSGLRDLMQNCYQPCSGPGCARLEKSGGKPGEYEKGDPWSGTYPSCQMPPSGP